jgi:hypothetical protein
MKRAWESVQKSEKLSKDQKVLAYAAFRCETVRKRFHLTSWSETKEFMREHAMDSAEIVELQSVMDVFRCAKYGGDATIDVLKHCVNLTILQFHLLYS